MSSTETLEESQSEAVVEGKKPSGTGGYVVLSKNESGWEVVTTMAGSSAGQAVRKVAESKGAGTYVAVPARSWQPLTVRVETETRLRVEEE